jgi:hypothetical protein
MNTGVRGLASKKNKFDSLQNCAKIIDQMLTSGDIQKVNKASCIITKEDPQKKNLMPENNKNDKK